jgi:hypothetical protein
MERYGTPDVLRLAEVPTPTPKANEVPVRVLAASVNDWDWGLLGGTPVNRMLHGLASPRVRIPGGVFASADVGPWCQHPLLAIWFSITRTRRVVFPLPKRSEAIVDAYRSVESGQTTGIVVIDVTPDHGSRDSSGPP